MNTALKIPNVKVAQKQNKQQNQSSLIQGIKDDRRTYTENLAVTLPDTQNAVLDLFSLGGAVRNRSEDEVIKMFAKAFGEDQLLALKCLFYLGDVRFGQGERRFFRVVMSWLGENYPDIVKKNIHNIPEYTRWDNLFSLLTTNSERFTLELIQDQLEKDWQNYMKGKPISLCAKWMKSLNTSSTESRKIAEFTRQYLDWSEKTYRQTLSALRKHIDVVERKMSSNRWPDINYSNVPSRASMIYRKAFDRHDHERYQKWLEDVKEGKAKIQSGVLYPHDIVHKVLNEGRNETLEQQWQNLPDYIGREHQGLAICDASGSMGCPISDGVKAIDVSLAISLYIAERAKGLFQNSFITFNRTPELQTIKGSDLYSRTKSLLNSRWGFNTDIQKVFNLILDTAKKKNIPGSEMPEVLYLVSDMDFDMACKDNSKTNFEVIKQKYENAGYKLPLLVFWNVNSRNSHAPVKFDERGVVLVSGFSPVILKSILAGDFENLTPLNLMLKTLNSERYEAIKV